MLINVMFIKKNMYDFHSQYVSVRLGGVGIEEPPSLIKTAIMMAFLIPYVETHKGILE